MKRWTSALVLGLILSLFMSGCGAGAPGPRLKVFIGTSASYPPFESVTDDRTTYVGFDIDLMKAIAAKTNLDVQFTSVDYKALLAGVADCTYDGAIAAITIDDTLTPTMDFSNPYFSDGQVVVVKKGNPVITGRETLAGQTVGVQTGTAGASEAAKIAGAHVAAYPVVDQAFDELIRGLIDAVVADKSLALGYASVRANNLKLVGDTFAGSSYGIAVCKQRGELLQRINTGLAAVRAEGTLNRLTQQWIVAGTR